MQVLAIDGGGSKTAFALVDQSGKILKSTTIPKGTNPWKQDVDFTCDILREGIARLGPMDGVVVCVAGISGCHEPTPFDTALVESIATLLSPDAHITLTGDLTTALNSHSEVNGRGIVALAGSGSSIYLKTASGQQATYSSVGYGGKDIAMMFVSAAQLSRLSERGVNWLQSFYERPLNEMSLEDAYQHRSTVAEVSIGLTKINDPVLAAEFAPMIELVGARWAYKLWNSYKNYVALSSENADSQVNVVLSGGAWELELMRATTIQQLSHASELIKIHYDKDRKPMDGAVKIALDLLKSTTR